MAGGGGLAEDAGRVGSPAPGTAGRTAGGAPSLPAPGVSSPGEQMSRNFRCALRPSSQYPPPPQAGTGCGVAPSLPPPPTAEPADGSGSAAGGLGRGAAEAHGGRGSGLGRVSEAPGVEGTGAARPGLLPSLVPSLLPQLLSPVSLRSSVRDLRSLCPTPQPSRVYADPLRTEPPASRQKHLLATSAEFFPPETPFPAFREPPHPQLAARPPSVETRSLSGEHGGRAGGEGAPD